MSSLQYGPKFIEGSYGCSNNLLTSLEHSPKYISGSFHCSNNQLLSLEGAPPIIFQINCANNLLVSLRSSIVEVKSRFYCNHNPIVSLKDCTTLIGNKFFHNMNEFNDFPILDFEGLYKYDNIRKSKYDTKNSLIIEIDASHFNAIIQSQKLEKMLPNKIENKNKNKKKI